MAGSDESVEDNGGQNNGHAKGRNRDIHGE